MSDSFSHLCNTRLNIPYPEVRVEGKNATYAQAMLSDMAEVVSEMSDVARYFYMATVTEHKHPDMSLCFHNISIVEMHHLHMFAELAFLLGADPRLWSGRQHNKKYWSPSFVRYPREVPALVMEAIRAEEAAIAKYSQQARFIEDPNIVAILRRIILDEQRHLEILWGMFKHLQTLP